MADHSSATARANAQKVHADRQAQKAQAERSELQMYFMAPSDFPLASSSSISPEDMVAIELLQ
jgi:hypothetical protein